MQQRILVRVLFGAEQRRSDTFLCVDSLHVVLRALFAEEVAQGRRVRLIYGGRTREESAAIADLLPAAGPVPDSITMHAVIGPPGSAAAAPASGASGAAASHAASGGSTGSHYAASAAAAAAYAAGGDGGDAIDVAGLKLRPRHVLLGILGAALGALWLLALRMPALFTRSSLALLAVFSLAFLSALRSACGLGGNGAGRQGAAAYPAAAPPLSASTRAAFDVGGHGGSARSSAAAGGGGAGVDRQVS
jgi:hypothetical protein